MSGTVSTSESEILRGQIVEFIDKTDDLRVADVTDETQSHISQLLEEHFILPQRNNVQIMRFKQKTN